MDFLRILLGAFTPRTTANCFLWALVGTRPALLTLHPVPVGVDIRGECHPPKRCGSSSRVRTYSTVISYRVILGLSL